MGTVSLRIDGVYDQRTASQTSGILLFDQRPKSSNFLQHHKLMEILKENPNISQVYLQFENEKNFVVEKLLNDLKEYFGDRVQKVVTLEFSDSLPSSYYEQFNWPFFWHYQENEDLESYLKLANFTGIVIRGETFEKWHEARKTRSALQNLSQRIFKVKKDLKFILKGRAKHVLRFGNALDFEWMAIDIDPEVEVCYRNVDMGKLNEELNQVKKFLNVGMI